MQQYEWGIVSMSVSDDNFKTVYIFYTITVLQKLHDINAFNTSF